MQIIIICNYTLWARAKPYTRTNTRAHYISRSGDGGGGGGGSGDRSNDDLSSVARHGQTLRVSIII